MTPLAFYILPVLVLFWIWASLINARLKWLEQREGKILDMIKKLADRDSYPKCPVCDWECPECGCCECSGCGPCPDCEGTQCDCHCPHDDDPYDDMPF